MTPTMTVRCCVIVPNLRRWRACVKQPTISWFGVAGAQRGRLRCPACGAEMRIVAFITQRAVIDRILDHCGALANRRGRRRVRSAGRGRPPSGSAPELLARAHHAHIPHITLTCPAPARIAARGLVGCAENAPAAAPRPSNTRPSACWRRLELSRPAPARSAPGLCGARRPPGPSASARSRGRGGIEFPTPDSRTFAVCAARACDAEASAIAKSAGRTIANTLSTR